MKKIKELFSKYKPNVVFNLAAESHVDRSIHSPLDFINTNILGTFNILNASLEYYLKHDLSEEILGLYMFQQMKFMEIYMKMILPLMSLVIQAK